jgi:hypothetical protein
MIGARNGQSQSEPELSRQKGRFTGDRFLRERPRVYRKVVELLADPGMSINQITKLCRVSEHTVRAVRDRKAISIAERKQRLMSIFGNVAELGAERMEELAGKASLRDAGTTAGIATDKLLALIGQTPPSVGVVIMPSETDFEERRPLTQSLTLSHVASPATSAQHFRSPYPLAVNPEPTNLQSREEHL